MSDTLSDPAAGSTNGSGSIVGVRVGDGRLVFVSGVPEDLSETAEIRCISDGVILQGRITIPAHLLFVDPDVPLAVYHDTPRAHTVPQAETTTVQAALYAFVADEDAPETALQEQMLALAFEELGRLDDPGSYPDRQHRSKRGG